MRNLSAIAVIPARGGSKRIPGKNMHLVHGKPMIAWVIETACSAGLFEDIVVSSEDEEILSVAREFGATAFRRPKELADDYTHVMPVVQNVLRALDNKPDTVCLIYATALLLKVAQLREAKNMLAAPTCESVLPVCDFPSPIQRAYKINDDNFLEMASSEYQYYRSQDLEERFRDCGTFYWWKLGKEKPKISALRVPSFLCVDIDRAEDLELALTLFDKQRNGLPHAGGPQL